MVKTVITQQRRYDYAASKMRALALTMSPRVVFDVGAGKGPMQSLAEQAGLTWYGFDLYPEKSTVAKWDLDDPCPNRNEKAGLVLMMDVIEHLLNPGLALDNIVEAMAADAHIIITTPNPRASRSRLHALFTGYPVCFTRQDLDSNHHLSRSGSTCWNTFWIRKVLKSLSGASCVAGTAFLPPACTPNICSNWEKR